MSRRPFVSGTWKGFSLIRDKSALTTEVREDVNNDASAGNNPGVPAEVPYPEATYWGAGTGGKVFSTTSCLLVDASGNVITNASGNAIACP